MREMNDSPGKSELPEPDSSEANSLSSEATTPDEGTQPATSEDATLQPVNRESNPLEAATIRPNNRDLPAHTLHAMQIGDYEVLDEIARGGMGIVYRARQKSLNRIVALKMILTGQFASAEDVDRFYSEAESAANLDHANIVPIYDIGKWDGKHYFSMKLIEGTNLGQRMSALHDDLPTAVALLIKVCKAIHHAHQRGILHRDLKPANILIDEDGEPYLTDFGLARRVDNESELTQAGTAIGTPSYMPPEQASCEKDVTTAADIYSIGAMLYEVLAGRPPFKGPTQMETLIQVINDQPELPSTHRETPYKQSDDRALELIAMKCLSKEPNGRYGSAIALANDLERWQRGEPISISAPSVYSLMKVWLNQNFGRGVWLLLVGGTVGIVSGISLWLATMQQTMGSKLQVYDQLPNASRPFTLFHFDTPAWLITPLLSLFACSIILLGFFTALMVRPKNRSADLAAGTIAGLIAAITSFLISFGTIGVISATSDADIQCLVDLAHSDHEAGAVPESVMAAYPELERYTKAEQLLLLQRKIEADHSSRVPWGILTGFMGSLALFFFAGVLETFTAGPIVRKHKTFLKSILPYLEMAFPISALTIVFGIFFTAWLTLGDSGAVNSLPLYAMFAFVVLAVTAKGLSWGVGLRHTVLAVCFALFVLFFVRDFPFVPKVSRDRVQLNRSEKLVEQNPENVEYGLQLGKNEIAFGDTLLSVGQGASSLEYFDRAIKRLDILSLEKGADLTEILPQKIRARLRKAAALESQGRVFQALQILQSLSQLAPEREDVKDRYFALCCSSDNPKVAKAFIESLVTESSDSFRQNRSVIASYARSLAKSKSLSPEEGQELFRKLLREHLEKSVDAYRDAEQELQRLANTQRWRLAGPMSDPLAIAAYSLQLVTQTESRNSQKQHQFQNLEALPGLPTDLDQLFGKGQFRSAFAIANLDSKTEQKVRLRLGCTNGATVWLNSRKVIDARDTSPFRSGKFEVELSIRRGINRLVVKTNQRDKGWLFDCVLDSVEGTPPEVSWASTGLQMERK